MTGDGGRLVDLLDEVMSVIASATVLSSLWPEDAAEHRKQCERLLAEIYARAQTRKGLTDVA